MAQTYDPAQLRAALTAIHPGTLSTDDAETIMLLAQMAVHADGQEDAEEIQWFFTLGKAVYALAGSSETPSPSLLDEDEDQLEQIRALVARLSTAESRRVAYGVAHLLSIVDVEYAPAEDQFLDQLRNALGIDDETSADLANQLSAAITPAE